jgi:Lon protease-like protein
MVSRCLEKHLVFGVVLSRGEHMTAVGCTAEIVKIVRTYEDGRSDILTVGRSPFRLLELHKDEPYLRGEGGCPAFS